MHIFWCWACVLYYTMEYYAAVKIKEILPMDGPGDIMLSEISQSGKDKYHLISLICGVYLTK